MKKMSTILPLLIIFTALLAAGAALAAGRGHRAPAAQDRMAAALNRLPFQSPDAEESAGLLQMREEEKLARDVYLTLGEKWQLQLFTRIARSEQRHMDAVKALLDKYSLADPIVDDQVGVFASAKMQQLYQQLTAAGQESAAKALWVGATIEDLDIHDLNTLIAASDNEDIRTVYQNLVKGSRNHLRAFSSWLAALETPYEAQYLTQEEVDAIVSSPREYGRYGQDGKPVGGCRGCRRGMRRGGGTGNVSGTGFVDEDGDGICDVLQQ